MVHGGSSLGEQAQGEGAPLGDFAAGSGLFGAVFLEERWRVHRWIFNLSELATTLWDPLEAEIGAGRCVPHTPEG